MKMPAANNKAIILIASMGFTLFSAITHGAGESSSPAFAQTQETRRNSQPPKEKWIESLTNVRKKLLNADAKESCKLIDEVLASLYRSEKLSDSDAAGYVDLIRSHIDDLIRRGDMETAFTLTRALPGDSTPDGPSHPARPGGTPGPGGLVLYFPFDQQATNGVVKDESGTGNDGRVEGAQWVSDGRIGGAYRFKITNLTDRIVIPDNDSLDFPNVTMAAWVKTTDTDPFWNRIFDKDFNKGYALAMGGGPSGEMRGTITGHANGSVTVSHGSVADGNWHHVAGTFDGNRNRLYVDGIEDQQTKVWLPLKTIGPLIPNNWDLCIGNTVVNYRNKRDFSAYDGLLDEVRLYNRVLSPDEIKALASSLQDGASAQPASTNPAPTNPNPAERIKQIKQLMEQGLIDKQEYDRRVKEILDAI